MNLLTIIAVIGFAALALDVSMTIYFGSNGVTGTCEKCNKKYTGTFLICFLKQTFHRCDDNLV